MLRESADREQAERDRLANERQQARDAQRMAAERATALDEARRELEHAIGAARAARRVGAGVAATDAAWQRAKARLIELETGSPPSWAHQVDDSP